MIKTGSSNRVVLLTVAMVVLAGVISSVASLLLASRTADSYDEALEEELEAKALAYGQTAAAFLDALGPDALPILQGLVSQAVSGSQDLAEPSSGFANAFLGFEAWLRDPGATGGYRVVFSDPPEGTEAHLRDDPSVAGVVRQTDASGEPTAAVDEDDQHIHVAIPIRVDEQTLLVGVGTLSAHDEFAFFAQQRTEAIRNAIILSAAIIGTVAVIGAALSYAVSRHLTDRDRAEEALREQTRRDPLTGVLNHAAIVEELQALLLRDGKEAQCAVAMVDVDGMKATNDTYGHQVGDAALIELARALAQDGALLGRYGGDEFVAIIHGANRAAAERYREQAFERLTQARLVDPESGLTVPLSATIGLAVHPEEARTVTDLIKLSDNAMYASRLRRPLPASGQAMPRRRDEQAAKMVGEMVPLLTSEGDLDDKLHLVAHRLCVGAGYDGVAFELLDPATGQLLTAGTFALVAEELKGAWEQHERQQGPHSLNAVLQRTLRPIIVADAQQDPRLAEAERGLLTRAGLRSLVVAPMLWHDQLVGSLAAVSKRASAFGPRDAQFLTAVATQVAAIVRMDTLLQQLQSSSEHLAQAREETVMLLAAAAEAHDRTIALHFRNVRSLAEALARELGYREHDAREVGLAAALHDIGKIRVPEGVLLKSGELTEEEWDSVRRHTAWGEEFLAGHTGFDLAATIARAHHERWDGSGYPDGLAGEAIPEAAAIVAVADAFDAMTSDRSYRAARPPETAIQEILAHSGLQFSPRVVRALLRLHERGALPVRQEETERAAA